MKYKVLLAGNSKKLISNFFLQMDFAFECMTSSMIFDDLKNHIQYFKPDIFIYCMRAETRDDLVTIASFHDVLGKNDVPYAAIGDSVSLDFAVKIPNCVPELSIKLPMSTSDMEDTITRFIKKHKAFLSSAADSPLSKALDLNTASAFDTLSKIDAALEAIEKDPNEKDTAGRQPEAPDRHRILVIDDATIIHKTIKGYLDSRYEVATAISGKIALRFLNAKEVSLILLDYEMPEMNGPAVLEELRKDPYLATIPVVFLTGINDVEKIKNALALKPQGYLLKPVEKEALIAKIRELIQ
ncbi:MAG: response regulator [Lachnospiraceae bacterium]|jgi:CheY-like chemotaxis protein|nr:response regulator [Lachnospiraceae bacterium]